MAEISAASNPISSAEREKVGRGESGDGRAQTTITISGESPGYNPLSTAPSGRKDKKEHDEEEPVAHSAVMLRFGAEVPSLSAAGKCGRTVQFPIPDDWNDAEVCVYVCVCFLISRKPADQSKDVSSGQKQTQHAF